MRFDVVISGAAMSGATLALALTRLAGKKVAVVDPHRPSKEHPGFDARSIALSYGTIELLKRFQLWDALEEQASPIRTIHVSDKGHFGQTGFEADAMNKPYLGSVVELEKVGQSYFQLLENEPEITLFCPDSVASVTQFQDKVEVGLSSGETLEAELLVAADGTRSKVAELLKIPNQIEELGQNALIANIELAEPHQGQAFERFTENGPLALLPMTQQRMSLVWCLDDAQLAQATQWDDETFLAQLQQAFGWRLGKLVKVGSRFSYPLSLYTRERTIHHRIAFVGNAAQTLHPIAGQGFNLGIRDVATLTEVIAQSTDVGSYRCLSEYRSAREDDRNATVGMTTGLVRLFSNNWAPTVVGRNLGLMAFDTLTPVQAWITNRSLGLVKN
ncbi:2-octaprenyl-6-methoxyphenyl hydroxylase [Vibrio ishigakensis]|uniref:2-octaprenyl-6-methoxyphenyl hydroxylase n=1 Tax=Vibrio ishigakensis TaxID=1481914 RepID=UPI0036F1D945